MKKLFLTLLLIGLFTAAFFIITNGSVKMEMTARQAIASMKRQPDSIVTQNELTRLVFFDNNNLNNKSYAHTCVIVLKYDRVIKIIK